MALLIYFDAVLTYAAIKGLGAVEVVLRFVYEWPESTLLVAAGKNAAVFYIFIKRRKYKWVDFAVVALSMGHAVALLNGGFQISAVSPQRRLVFIRRVE